VKSVVKKPVTPSGGRVKIDIDKIFGTEEKKSEDPLPKLKCCNKECLSQEQI